MKVLVKISNLPKIHIILGSIATIYQVKKNLSISEADS